MSMEHVQSLIPDYVLELLDPEARRLVETHTQACATCRHVLAQERQVARLVGLSIQSVTRPKPARIQALRPLTRAPRGRGARAHLLTSLAPIAVVAMLLLAGLMGRAGHAWRIDETLLPGAGRMLSSPTATATQTHTPTATLAAAPPVYETEAAGPRSIFSASRRTPASMIGAPAVMMTPLPTSND